MILEHSVCGGVKELVVTFRLEAPNISRNFAKYETKWALLFRFVSFRFVSFSSEYMVSYFVSFRLSSQDAFHLIKPDQIFR